MITQLPDRGALGPGLLSSLFVFRQPFVWAPALVGTLAAGVWLGFLTVQNGTTDSVWIAVLLAPVMGAGFAVLTGLPLFMLYRLVRQPKSVLALDDGEDLVEELRANHFLGHEGRGGRLVLTTQRVAFLPHRFNVQMEPTHLLLRDVQGIGWRRQLNGRDLVMATTIELESEGRTEVFVVKKADEVAARVAGLK